MVFVPIMASRLMLSLRKAAVRTKLLWSLDAMGVSSSGRLPARKIIRFAPQVSSALHDTLTTPALDEDIELPAMPQSPRTDRPRQAR